MCEHGNTKTLIIKDKPVDIDSCIFSMVKMFNENGYETIASCCGHGKIPSSIALTDGRFIDIHPNRESWIKKAERIKELEKIADLAYDLHTKDPLNIKKKWGVSGVKAEKLLCEMIEKGV